MDKTVAAVSVFAVLLAPQLPPPDRVQGTPTFRTKIDLVQVDVVVVDKDGRPVEGLKAADFTILDRRKPQSIAAFEEVAHKHDEAAAAPALLSAITPDVSSNQTAQAGRLIVMVIDDLHVYKERTDRAKSIARQVLSDLGPQSSMAVLFTSQEHSTQVTADQSRLLAAIETLRGRQSWRRPHQATDAQTGPQVGPEDSMETALAKIQQGQDTNVQDFFDNITQYKTLQDAARMLGGGDARRKAFVLLSEGIGKELSGLFGAMAPPGDVPTGGAAYASGNLEGLTHVQPTGYHDIALIQMMEAMRRSNVATYAIDPRGKVESKDLARECFPAPKVDDPCSNDMAWYSVVRQAQHGLEITSEASGGFAVTNTDDFTSGVKRIVEDLDHYYLLGFYPSDSKGREYRPIDVKIAGHPDWRLRFRRGYMPGGPPAPPRNADPLVALSAGILPKTELPLRLTAIPVPGASGTTRVVLALEVSAPWRDLLEADGKVRDTLKYEVLIVDEKKARVRTVKGLEGRLTLSPLRAAEPAPDVMAYEVSDAIDVLPGHYEFRVSAVSAKLAKGGSVYLAIDVPDFRAAPIVIGGLSVNYADGSRVPVAPKAGPPALPFPPSLDRAFTAGDTLRVYFEAAIRVGSASVVPSLDVIDAGGRVVRSPSPSFASGDPMRVDATIPLTGLAPGGYVLRATLGSGATKAAREIGFLIR